MATKSLFLRFCGIEHASMILLKMLVALISLFMHPPEHVQSGVLAKSSGHDGDGGLRRGAVLRRLLGHDSYDPRPHPGGGLWLKDVKAIEDA